ncbi:HdeD family acid-resistance protein [Undibacterium terreum]|uniref:DUF308 domain-containing protein n=1 Tax=Undibacterium terreum TaxID=1224302 RepID=A0A916UZ79_9BURK|nr:DUF308 domain-containing protein [Undibacterium terreum]GGC95149.1 hypothetical protein GCM10011396_48120 [Undibacterium terreum]
MIRLVLLLLGVDFMRERWRLLRALGWIWSVAGIIIFIDALDNALCFPIDFFAYLLLANGISTLLVSWTGVGGQRSLRLVKGAAYVFAGLLVLAGVHLYGNFLLSMIFGTLFLADGVLQATSATLVRFPRWKLAFAVGMLECAIALFFYQPYPTHYVGTVPYCIGLGLIFGGWQMLLLSYRVHRLSSLATVESVLENGADSFSTGLPSESKAGISDFEWDGPPTANEKALTVHVWTPVGSAKTEAQRMPIVDRYIAAVDVNGIISTGHAALETPEGIYISLYPGVEIDHSPDDFSRLLRATHENDVPGVFQPDYATESQAWCPSTVKVRIRNYNAGRLHAFWETYQQDKTYNLTWRNCSSSVAKALEAALEGVVGKVQGRRTAWTVFVRLLLSPELWVAAQIRKRAKTMAWTPGLTLDYARALSMLADPRPAGWIKMMRISARKISRLGRKQT